MNTIVRSLIHVLIGMILSLGLTSMLMAQESVKVGNPGEATFTVLGNCGMCKDRIERAAYTVRGVRSASWNQEKQSLKVMFRPERTNQEQIERAVAKAGHDTQNFLTHDDIHANLHHCCIYKRDPELLKKNKKFDDI
jgi:copper chaperone CopZ